MEWVYLTAIVILIALASIGLAFRGTKRLKGRPQPKGYMPPPKATPPPVRSSQVRPSEERRAKSNARPVINGEEEKINKLATLVNDKARAHRLVAGVEEEHPDKSRLWCIEKAIEDALRDIR